MQWVSVCVEPILAYFPVRFNQFNSHLSIWEVIEKIRGRKEPSRSSKVVSSKPVPFRLIYPEQRVLQLLLEQSLQVKSTIKVGSHTSSQTAFVPARLAQWISG